MFFDDNGMFRLDEMVTQSPTFLKIMDDKYVSDSELNEQSQLVLNLYREIEDEFTEEQLAKIARVIVETGVLQSVSQYRELQELHK